MGEPPEILAHHRGASPLARALGKRKARRLLGGPSVLLSPDQGLGGPRGNGRSEPELTVRRLAAALALRQGGLFGREVHRRAGQHLVDVAAHDAATVRAVPIPLDNHRTSTLRTRLGGCFLQSWHVSLSLQNWHRYLFEDRKNGLEAGFRPPGLPNAYEVS